ncbi:sarcosine oxidase subunit beta [Rhodobium orientis]|uniref:Sarcosine oxidase subunit beta n=1 Tax=Rhodobium orientis TaxID=34017 RepID=A0A327JZE2_9HYPH|nr:sarcosine oxidase subunit beta family protein [Rhodobium orientis]MBB4303663.1 sarcosine oxidase subunit beta [Rhodobium orientis]MBK5951881.1 sarcosine oxidase subunit beta [Rhodobium orientis]RAI28458.1 sarcosine oxidase subunit beta [Rhodobium orientis]
MGNYSLFSIVREGLRGNTGWTPAWRDPDPKPSYDAVIIGGGGHGLATAYYLAKIHGMKNIAVVEKGWIGGGNSGRNTTIIRSNYLYDASAAIYEHALKLWEGLSQELNYNIMMSHRGVLNLAHDDNEARQLKRRVEANRLNGVDAEYLGPKEIKEFCPILNTSPDIRYPVIGATLQRRGGTNRHDAVCWGYARAADALGVDIIQNCEVTEILTERGQVTGLRTSRGDIRTEKVASVTAGHTSVIAGMVGVRLPIESHPLQALVSEPLKPVNPCVVMSNAVHVYCSQSDKGELVIGAGIDGHTSYTQRGSLDIIEHQMAAIVELFPIFSRLRMMRQWGGIVDVCPDASPIISKTEIGGFYVNGGWGTGGWKATPGSGHAFADLVANDAPNAIAAPFTLERFVTGDLVAEHGAAAVAH